jgi:hypothetical protein
VDGALPRAQDTTPSLSFAEKDGKALWHCHKGCSQEVVRSAIYAKLGQSCNGQDTRANGVGAERVATYEYTDAAGQRVFYRDRFEWIEKGEPKKKVLPRQLDGTTKGSPPYPYRLHRVVKAIAENATIILVEGEKCVDALEANGYIATTTGSATSWKKKFATHFMGARVILWPDADAAGETYIGAVARDLRGLVADLRVLRFNGKPEGWDAANYFSDGGTDTQLDHLLADARPYAAALATPTLDETRVPGPVSLRTLDEVVKVFETWMHLPDPLPLIAALGAVSANRLPGDPVWLGLIAPPSSAKTEILNAIGKLPNMHHAATITPAALLSGTSKRERAANAKGGLLKQIGNEGILVIKDFTSILSMRPDAKAEILAALREVFDGSWTRHVGSDGGQELTWEGKLGLIFGCTPIIDSHHGVIGTMGERFLLCRIAPADRAQAVRALKHSGARTAAMRRELADAVCGLFATARQEPQPRTSDEETCLVRWASLAVRLRSTVERDRQTREIEAVYGAEGPARLVLTLAGLLDGLDVLGCDRKRAMSVVRRVAFDSVPPLRRKAYDLIRKLATEVSTKGLAERLDLPTVTVRRILEDLAAYGLLRRIAGTAVTQPDTWTLPRLSK